MSNKGGKEADERRTIRKRTTFFFFAGEGHSSKREGGEGTASLKAPADLPLTKISEIEG